MENGIWVDLINRRIMDDKGTAVGRLGSSMAER